jgi:Rrf2 family iron-sulfur cluster assembly transcriptional regulator
MRLSTKGRFAVTTMVDLALREPQGPVALSALSVRHKISTSYLEQLFSRLRQHGLVASTRGPGGGYSLGRAAHAISVADIIAAVEGGDSEAEGCALTNELWRGLNLKMAEYLQSVTLRQLVDEQVAKGVRIEPRASSKRGIFAQPVKEKAPRKAAIPNSVFALAGTLASGS